MEFSNDDQTIRKKGSNFSSTALGDNVFSDGLYEWEVELNEMIGSYICIGAIKSDNDWNLKGDNYSSAMCVCSDNCVYGMNKVEGNLTIQKGDVIRFKMDLDQGEFEAIGPNKRYIYKAAGLKGFKYVAFLGFSSGSQFKITIRGV